MLATSGDRDVATDNGQAQPPPGTTQLRAPARVGSVVEFARPVAGDAVQVQAAIRPVVAAA